jgi:hypothetical protein
LTDDTIVVVSDGGLKVGDMFTTCSNNAIALVSCLYDTEIQVVDPPPNVIALAPNAGLRRTQNLNTPNGAKASVGVISFNKVGETPFALGFAVDPLVAKKRILFAPVHVWV